MSNENTFDPSMGKVIPVDIEKEMRKSFWIIPCLLLSAGRCRMCGTV